MTDVRERKDRKILERVHSDTMRLIKALKGPGLGKMSEITTHIYMSNWQLSCDIKLMREHNIAAILCVDQTDKPPEILKAYKKRKIEQLQIRIADTPSEKILPHFEMAYNFMQHFIASDKKVLIHCAAGVSRSAAFVLYYLLKRYYLTNFKKLKSVTKDLIDTNVYFLPRIVQFVKENRACIEPNEGFIDQLLWSEYRMKKHFERILELEAINYRENHKPANPADVDDENDPDLFPQKKEESIDHYIDKLFEEKSEQTRKLKKKKAEKEPDEEPEEEPDENSKTIDQIIDESLPSEDEKPKAPTKSTETAEGVVKKRGRPKKVTVVEPSKPSRPKGRPPKNKPAPTPAPTPTPSRVSTKEDKLSDLADVDHSEDEPEPEEKNKKDDDDSDESD
jgi:hypothetical protein